MDDELCEWWSLTEIGVRWSAEATDSLRASGGRRTSRYCSQHAMVVRAFNAAGSIRQEMIEKARPWARGRVTTDDLRRIVSEDIDAHRIIEPFLPKSKVQS